MPPFWRNENTTNTEHNKWYVWLNITLKSNFTKNLKFYVEIDTFTIVCIDSLKNIFKNLLISANTDSIMSRFHENSYAKNGLILWFLATVKNLK